MVSIMPKTVTAETAATPRAKFLFFSILFSSFSLESKSVTLTLFVDLSSVKVVFSELKFTLMTYLNIDRILRNLNEVQNGFKKNNQPNMRLLLIKQFKRVEKL